MGERLSLRRGLKTLVRATIALVTIAAFMFAWSIDFLVAAHPAMIGDAPADLAAENVRIAARTGNVAGWFTEGQKDHGIVVLLHGVRADRRSQIERMRLLRSQGYGVLAIDLPGHGESEGSFITFGYHESRAVLDAVAYLAERAPGRKIAVVGQSLGGASVIYAGPELAVSAVVLEGVYGDIRTATANRMRAYLGAPGGLLSPVLVTVAGWWLGISPSALQPAISIATINAPKLIIGGGEDKRATVQESRDIFEAARDPKELWIVPVAGHVDFYGFASTSYRARVLPFLAQHLSSGNR